jgi:hypothetical protein
MRRFDIGAMNVDPMLVDSASGDYHLAQNSPGMMLSTRAR